MNVPCIRACGERAMTTKEFQKQCHSQYWLSQTYREMYIPCEHFIRFVHIEIPVRCAMCVRAMLNECECEYFDKTQNIERGMLNVEYLPEESRS